MELQGSGHCQSWAELLTRSLLAQVGLPCLSVSGFSLPGHVTQAPRPPWQSAVLCDPPALSSLLEYSLTSLLPEALGSDGGGAGTLWSTSWDPRTSF